MTTPPMDPRDRHDPARGIDRLVNPAGPPSPPPTLSPRDEVQLPPLPSGLWHLLARTSY
jgi:hypothetical protein